MTYVHSYNIMQSIFTALKNLCPSLPLTTADLFIVSIVLPFSRISYRIIQYVALQIGFFHLAKYAFKVPLYPFFFSGHAVQLAGS